MVVDVLQDDAYYLKEEVGKPTARVKFMTVSARYSLIVEGIAATVVAVSQNGDKRLLESVGMESHLYILLLFQLLN
jgi:hypothetical protein